MKTNVLIAAGVFLSGMLHEQHISAFFKGTDQVKTQHLKQQQKNSAAGIVIKAQWDLPEILREVSGIAYMGNDRFACVQDELGTIFIFNKATDQIEKEIVFAGPGDFEGIAINGNTAYVMRADGMLFEVDLVTKKANEYVIPATAVQNIESLCYDNKNNRLLLLGKDDDPDHSGFKHIYAFSLSQKEFLAEPVYRIDLNKEMFTGSSKKSKVFRPSAIGINPLTNNIFIIDEPKAKLFELDDKGSVKSYYELGKAFAKPEGITFTAEGDIYISNEGKKNAANIIQVLVQ